MWIERIELIGFGNLGDEKIEFQKDKLNLVVEQNEYGKSTLAEAIWATLYDFPQQRGSDTRLKEREARKPQSGKQYKVSLDLVRDDRQLRVVRDFGERTVKVFDRGKGGVEVTEEFLSGANDDEVGLKLTGMGRELFRRTCYVGQRELDEHTLGTNRDLSRDLASLLQSIADSSGSATTSATAIGVLEDTLNHFPYKGKKHKVDKLLKELEERKVELFTKARRMEEDKLAMRVELKRLSELEAQIDTQEKQVQSAEYFHLCLEAGEFDSRLLRAQERLLRVSELKRQMALVTQFANFPVDRLKKVEELWTTRQSRLGDLERLQKELDNKEKHMMARDLELRERWEGLSGFTIDDAQDLVSTARTLQNVLTEFQEAEQKRQSEQKHVKEEGVDLENLAGVRKALLNLDARDLDDAYAYNAMINSAREQIGACERSIWRARIDLDQAKEKRNLRIASRRNLVVGLGLLTMLTAVIVVGIILGLQQKISDPMGVLGLICLGFVVGAFVVGCVMFVQAKVSFQKDIDAAMEEDQKQATTGQELHSKVMGLEIRLEDLARKAGVVNGAELVKLIQAYATAAARLKDLDLLDQVILSRESHVVKLRGELEEYFSRAGRGHQEVSPENALKLSEDINHYLEDRRGLESSAGLLENKGGEIAFLKDQLKDIDKELKEHFVQANLEHADDMVLAYDEFLAGVKGQKQWDKLRLDIEHMQEDTDLAPDELPKIIERLKAQRDSAWEHMQQLVVRCPNIAELPPPALDPQDPSFGKEIAAMKDAVDELRKERQELTVHVRAATKAYDENYTKAVEEKEEIDADIQAVTAARTALVLARDHFQHLSEETHSHWSGKLNEIAREMLSSMGTDFDSLHFDSELALTASRKGQPEPLQPANIKSQLSIGTREQLHWLARMAVVRFLSQDVALPLVLDEPFSESDDHRFLSMVSFLMKNLLQHHQVIMFSCHHARHRWLKDELDAELKDLVEFCQLEPVAVAS